MSALIHIAAIRLGAQRWSATEPVGVVAQDREVPIAVCIATVQAENLVMRRRKNFSYSVEMSIVSLAKHLN